MCRSVLHQWSALTAVHVADIAALDVSAGIKNELEHTLSGASQALAEMYDAYALWCFGNLGMLVVSHELSLGTSEETRWAMAN